MCRSIVPLVSANVLPKTCGISRAIADDCGCDRCRRLLAVRGQRSQQQGEESEDIAPGCSRHWGILCWIDGCPASDMASDSTPAYCSDDEIPRRNTFVSRRSESVDWAFEGRSVCRLGIVRGERFVW